MAVCNCHAFNKCNVLACLLRTGMSIMSNMAAGRHLGFFELESFTARLAVPENPTLEPISTKCHSCLYLKWNDC